MASVASDALEDAAAEADEEEEEDEALIPAAALDDELPSLNSMASV